MSKKKVAKVFAPVTPESQKEEAIGSFEMLMRGWVNTMDADTLLATVSEVTEIASEKLDALIDAGQDEDDEEEQDEPEEAGALEEDVP